MAAEHYRSAQLVLGWSFYRQGTSGHKEKKARFLGRALFHLTLGKREDDNRSQYRHQH
jgi:hypothetical protein